MPDRERAPQPAAAVRGSEAPGTSAAHPGGRLPPGGGRFGGHAGSLPCWAGAARPVSPRSGRIPGALGARWSMVARAGAAAAAAASAEDEGGVRSVSLPRPPSPEALAEEGRWLGDVMCFHLDEEWTPLEVHRRLGDRLAEVYARVREGDGGDEVGAVIMSLTEELLSFNFREAFVSRFEVANKAGEVLMMRAGMDVCCTSPDDESLLERFSAHQQAEAEATGGGGGSP